MILPTATLVLAVTPYVARIVRASMIEVLESDYVEMARLKGLSERTVLMRHALPNALGPTFQVIAINLAYLAGGVIVVEYIFNYAGIGGALRDGVNEPRHPGRAGARDADRRGLRRAQPARRHRDDHRHARACGRGCERDRRHRASSAVPEAAAARRPTGRLLRSALGLWRTRMGLAHRGRARRASPCSARTSRRTRRPRSSASRTRSRPTCSSAPTTSARTSGAASSGAAASCSPSRRSRPSSASSSASSSG